MRKIYMVSDLDNTLLNSQKQISKKNLEAIQKFVDAGNYFGIATGRSYESAEEYVRQLSLYGPSILCNGTMLMDKQKNLVHENKKAKEKLLPFFEAVKKALPKAAIKIFLIDRFVDVSGREDAFRLQDDYPAEPRKVKDLMHDKWYKALIIEKENQALAYQLSQEYLDDQYYCMFSDKNLMEIMPSGVSKGQALKQLAEEYQCFSVAIGDYENDMEMIEMADFGVAVANALDCVKAKAKYISKHHDEDAIADVIEKVLQMQQDHLLNQ